MVAVDKKELGKALRRLRETKFKDEQALFAATGIYPPTIKTTEAGANLPNILIIEKWVTACGSTLPEFFSQFESEPGGTSTEVSIVHGYEAWYRLLTEIIESDQKFFKDGIHANLIAMRNQATVEATTAEDGNLSPKEKKKETLKKRRA